MIEPERTPSGYRKFYVDDVDRLKSILRMQRDEYLPLKVIKERLLNQGGEELFDEDGVAIEVPSDGGSSTTASEELAEAPTGLQMSLEEMSAATGVERDRIKELESFGIVCSHGPDGAKYYDGDDYIVLSIVKDFFRFGVEPRHLTMYKHFEEREADFFEHDRGAHAPPEEPGRASRGLTGARRPGGHVAEVQAGAPPLQPAGRPAERVTHRRPRLGRVSLIVAVGIIAQASLIGLASAQLAPPPPTPVPPDGSLSPFPQSLDTPSDAAVPPALSAPSALLADLDTGQVLFSKDPDSRRPIASLTKIMTGLLVLERSQPSDIVTVGEDASIPEDDRAGISALGLEVGEQITRRGPPLRTPPPIGERRRRSRWRITSRAPSDGS